MNTVVVLATGLFGTAGNGEKILCTDNDGWHLEQT
jgi:hypothetical protein